MRWHCWRQLVSNRNGDYDASGTFEATEVIVSAEGNGRIERFDVEEGQRLTAGEVVGSIDSIQLYLKKLQLEKSIGATQSRRQDIAKQIAATLEQIDKQKLEQRRVQNLIRSNAANTKQLDDIDSRLAVLEKQLAAPAFDAREQQPGRERGGARGLKYRLRKSKTSSANAGSRARYRGPY